MKYDTFADYDPRAVQQTLPAFLTVWAGLGRYHGDLVLLGGLVPQFICQHPAGANALPRSSTLDVDFGIALGASGGQYGTLATDLSAQGFQRSKKHPARFEKTIGGFVVHVDFLTENPPASIGSVAVDDITASVMPGVNRALATARVTTVEGLDIHGARQRISARVCEVGPFVALKLRAFLHRQQPKDAFDLLYTLRHYDGGTHAAVAAFAEEVRAGNPACADARACLARHFDGPVSPAPAKAAYFAYGERTPGEPADQAFRRAQIANEMVMAAELMRREIESQARAP